ncbi:hypothetical protein DFH27DRAFT_613163 [Peziza echinospora]|nr:hypothetical protein DFH27DRAFT_613163 [Peziza echinospora]
MAIAAIAQSGDADTDTDADGGNPPSSPQLCPAASTQSANSLLAYPEQKAAIVRIRAQEQKPKSGLNSIPRRAQSLRGTMVRCDEMRPVRALDMQHGIRRACKCKTECIVRRRVRCVMCALHAGRTSEATMRLGRDNRTKAQAEGRAGTQAHWLETANQTASTPLPSGPEAARAQSHSRLDRGGRAPVGPGTHRDESRQRSKRACFPSPVGLQIMSCIKPVAAPRSRSGSGISSPSARPWAMDRNVNCHTTTTTMASKQSKRFKPCTSHNPRTRSHNHQLAHAQSIAPRTQHCSTAPVPRVGHDNRDRV